MCLISQDEFSHGVTFPIARLVFPECYCISGNLFYKTTFPIVPVAVLVSHDASHMRNVPTLVLADVYKNVQKNTNCFRSCFQNKRRHFRLLNDKVDAWAMLEEVLRYFA